MKRYFLLIILWISILFSYAQNMQKIFEKSWLKCQSIQNGSYGLNCKIKFMMQPDTAKYVPIVCYFKKLPNDSLISSAFHIWFGNKDTTICGEIYTGNEYVWYGIQDSTGLIVPKDLYPTEVVERISNTKLFSPLTQRISYPLPNEKNYLSNPESYTYLGKEKVGMYNCYHIQRRSMPKNDSLDPMYAFQILEEFWIHTKDYVPVQYSIRFDNVYLGKDTLIHWEQLTLTHYELNKLQDDSFFQLSSIPVCCKLSNYVPYQESSDTVPEPTLLDSNITAPLWTLVSLENDTIRLSDYKGQVVLLDFFYKSCYPCMLALPALQKLHEKYKDQGLKVIGINPYDKRSSDIAKFLSNHINYTVVLDGKEVAETYKVRGYPTLYLINKEGKIVFSQTGFGIGLEKSIEEEILKHL